MKKETRMETYNRLRQNFESVIKAKDYATGKLIETGKRMGQLFAQMRMKKHFSRAMACILVVAMVLTSVSIPTLAADSPDLSGYTELSSGGTSSRTLSGGQYKVTSDTTMTDLKISGEVTIYIASGKKLTCTGSDANGTTGGKAGINLPSGATLILEGAGTVVATGGNASNGGNGSNGGSGHYDSSANVAYPGTGGTGGYGGGGAGAGIGGNGGNGGNGGATRNYSNNGSNAYVGADGNPGNSGEDGEKMGTLYIKGTITVNATGGEYRTTGNFGNKGSGVEAAKFACAYGGGGGGGAGSAIGSGGGGGAGAGSGGTSSSVWNDDTSSLKGGGTNGEGGSSGYFASASSSGNGGSAGDGGKSDGVSSFSAFSGGAAGSVGSGGKSGTVYYTTGCEINGTEGSNLVNSSSKPGAVSTWSVLRTLINFVDSNTTSSTTATNMPSSQSVNEGDAPTRPANPTKVGYTFDNWYKEQACSNLFDFTTGRTSFETETAYAKFTPNEYTATFVNGEGATGGVTSAAGTFDAVLPTITGDGVSAPVKEGSVFIGYYDSATGGNLIYKPDLALNTSLDTSKKNWRTAGNVTYYAHWLDKPTFNPVSGSVEKNATISITTNVADAKIYYTTNGDTPTTSSTEYTSAISMTGFFNEVTKSVTLKAIAVYNGATTEVVEESYLLPPNVSSTDETIYGKEDGTITGTNADMEYCKAGESTYTPITGDTISDLGMGTYYVRYKGTDSAEPSLDTEVVIGAGTKLSVTFPADASTYGYKIKDVTETSVNVKWNQDYTFTLVLEDGYSDTVNGGIKVYLDENSSQPLTAMVNGKEYTYTISNIQTNHTVKVEGIVHHTDKLTIPETISFSRDFSADSPEGENLVITNAGTRDGMIKSITIDGTHADQFEAITLGTTSVSVGGTLETYQIQPKGNLSVGEYSATVTVTYYTNAAKTQTDSATANITYTVTPKTLTADDVKLKSNTLYYTGAKVRPVLVLEADADVVIAESEYTVVFENGGINVGTDKVTFTDANVSGGDYTLPTDSSASFDINIEYLTTTAEAQLQCSEGGANGWYRGDVSVKAPEGYQITSSIEGGTVTWGNALPDITGEGSNDVTYYLKRTSDEAITDAKTITVRIDKEAPTASITIESTSWSTWPGSFLWDTLFGEKKAVTVTAEDPGDGSGDVQIYYLLSDEEYNETSIQGINTWTSYTGSFNLKENKNIVYVKAVDKAGNVKYISTQGLIVDTTAPVFDGLTDGGSYCGAISFSVTDRDVSTVTLTVDGSNVTLTNGSYTISAADATHIIKAVDAAGHETTCTITQHADHAWSSTGTVTQQPTATRNGVTTYTCTNGCVVTKVVHDIPMKGLDGIGTTDEEKLKEFVAAANTSLTDDDITEEETQALNGYLATAKDYLKDIATDKQEDLLEEIENAELPATDKITSAEKQKVEDLLEKIEDMLREDDDYLTESQKQALNDKKEALDNLKDEITRVEEKLKGLGDRAEAIPDTDHVNTDNKSAMTQLSNDIQNCLTNEADHLTETEKQALTDRLNELADKQQRLTQVETKLTELKQQEDALPDTAPVSEEELTAIQDLLDKVEQFKKDYGTNLSSGQGSELQTVCNALVERLRDIMFQIELVESQNGTVSASAIEAKPGTTITLTADPKVGYTFNGWKVISGGMDIINNQFAMPMKNVKLEAIFTRNSSGGGSSSGDHSNDSGNSGSSSITVPVTGDQNAVQVSGTVTDTTVALNDIKTEDINKLANEASVKTNLEIDLTGLKQDVDSVILPAQSMKEIANTVSDQNNKIQGLTIKLPTAIVEMDASAVVAVVDQSKNKDIQLKVEEQEISRLGTKQQAALEYKNTYGAIDAYFISDGVRIGDFRGGSVTVRLPFTVPEGKDASMFSVWYVAENGSTTAYETQYDEGFLVFTVDHFSDYVVVYEGEEDETKTEIVVDTSFAALRLAAIKSTKTTNVLQWAKVADADGYVLYGAPCNTKGKVNKSKKLAVIKNGTTTTYTDKKLKSGTYYKYFIKAYKLVNGKKVWLARSKTIHVTTTGGKYGNAKAVKVNKTKVTLKNGKSLVIKASQIARNKPIKQHVNIKYESTNTKIATVTRNGRIKAKSAGTCTIYVYAQNGMYRKVKVTVK